MAQPTRHPAGGRRALARPRPGFSLTELLVVMGIIVVLLAIVLVSLRAVRGQSERAATGATLRQLSQAFSNYSTDNAGALLPGYLSEDVSRDRVGARVRDPNGNDISGTEDAAPYVWRLADYLDDWSVVLTGYSTGLKERFSQEVLDGAVGGASAGADQLGVARAPAIGMNTTWVGGDDRHFRVEPGNPGEFGNRDPWSNPYETQAVTSAGEIRNPARLVIFAPTSRWNAETWAPAQGLAVAASQQIGSPALMPPLFPDAGGALQPDFTWTGGVTEATIENPNAAGSWEADAGRPALRGFADEERVPIGRFDGSFTSATLPELQADTRFWDPKANAIRVGEND